MAERGSAVLVAIAALALSAALVVGLSRAGDVVVRQHRAAATADVVALAGAAHGEARAGEVARRNDAGILEVIVGPDGSFAVTVTRAGARADAAAVRG